MKINVRRLFKKHGHLMWGHVDNLSSFLLFSIIQNEMLRRRNHPLPNSRGQSSVPYCLDVSLFAWRRVSIVLRQIISHRSFVESWKRDFLS